MSNVRAWDKVSGLEFLGNREVMDSQHFNMWSMWVGWAYLNTEKNMVLTKIWKKCHWFQHSSYQLIVNFYQRCPIPERSQECDPHLVRNPKGSSLTASQRFFCNSSFECLFFYPSSLPVQMAYLTRKGGQGDAAENCFPLDLGTNWKRGGSTISRWLRTSWQHRPR